jgi:septal ring factor EnvC (AmiA/AmiB activator)
MGDGAPISNRRAGTPSSKPRDGVPIFNRAGGPPRFDRLGGAALKPYLLWAGICLLLALAGGAAFAAALAGGAARALEERPANPARPAREAELAAIRREIGRLEGRLEQARRQKSGLEGELAAADLELALEEQRLAEAVAARQAAAERESLSAAQVRLLEGELDGSRRAFRRRLSGLYRLGRQGYLRLFFLLKPDERLLPSIRLMRYLVRRDRESVDRYQEARQRLGAERDRLLGEERERDAWIARETARRGELVAARRRKAVLLARVERERRDLASRADELTDKARKLASFLDLLYGSNGAALAGTPLQQFRGVLDWPAQGRVTERFGPRLDPRYHTQVPHNGIDLATTPGSEVKVVFPGKVLFAAAFEGYGPTVVVLHPGRVFTLYAGLAQLKAGKEDMVSLGDTVGLAADRLYFEIRVENRPDDPLGWLR